MQPYDAATATKEQDKVAKNNTSIHISRKHSFNFNIDVVFRARVILFGCSDS